LINSAWYAIILRNIPATCTLDNIKGFCRDNTSSLLYVINPVQIKNSYCAIAVLSDLDEAEKLCKALNKKTFGKHKRIKVNLHPNCCKIRKNVDKSHYSQYFKNKNAISLPPYTAPTGTPLPKFHDSLYSPAAVNNVKKSVVVTKPVEPKTKLSDNKIKENPIPQVNNIDKVKNIFTSLLTAELFNQNESKYFIIFS
jgi:hypothetical protein